MTFEHEIDLHTDIHLTDHEGIDLGFRIDITASLEEGDIKIGEMNGFIGSEDELFLAFKMIAQEMYIFMEMYKDSKVDLEEEDYYLDKLIYIDTLYLDPKWHNLGIEKSVIKTLYQRLGCFVDSIWYIVRPEIRDGMDGCPLYPEDPEADKAMQLIFRGVDFRPKKRDCYDYMFLLCESPNMMTEVKHLNERADIGYKDCQPYIIDLEARRAEFREDYFRRKGHYPNLEDRSAEHI